jgi:flagellar assembly factor FliW
MAMTDVRPDQVLDFPEGIPGFEACRRFVLLSSSDTAPLHCLRVVGGPPVSFIGIDPRRVVPDYPCELTESDRIRLGNPAGQPLVWLALVTVAADGSATANLRAPVVINPERMIGCQLVPCESPYSLRQALPLD